MVCICVLQALTKGGVTYKDEVWHKECFLCMGCKAPLAGQPFTSQGESPYCVKCFSSLYAKKCAGCNTAITGKRSTRPPSKQHPWFSSGVGLFVVYHLPFSLPDSRLPRLSLSKMPKRLSSSNRCRQSGDSGLWLWSFLCGLHVWIYPLLVLCSLFLLFKERISQ